MLTLRFEISSNACGAWAREDDVMKHMRKYTHRGIFGVVWGMHTKQAQGLFHI